jgi:hypothetical protein
MFKNVVKRMAKSTNIATPVIAPVTSSNRFSVLPDLTPKLLPAAEFLAPQRPRRPKLFRGQEVAPHSTDIELFVGGIKRVKGGYRKLREHLKTFGLDNTKVRNINYLSGFRAAFLIEESYREDFLSFLKRAHLRFLDNYKPSEIFDDTIVDATKEKIKTREAHRVAKSICFAVNPRTVAFFKMMNDQEQDAFIKTKTIDLIQKFNESGTFESEEQLYGQRQRAKNTKYRNEKHAVKKPDRPLDVVIVKRKARDTEKILDQTILAPSKDPEEKDDFVINVNAPVPDNWEDMEQDSLELLADVLVDSDEAVRRH